jgi:hypothetical protein
MRAKANTVRLNTVRPELVEGPGSAEWGFDKLSPNGWCLKRSALGQGPALFD